MKSLLILLLIVVAMPALSQQAPATVQASSIVERVDLSGLDEAKLSAELRADIQKLIGQPYSAQAVEALTQDIQVEFPEYVAAATTQPGSQPGRVRVVLLAAKISDDDALKNNINSRYIVDAIEFEGIKVEISSELNSELQKMVGGNVDSGLLSNLGERIARENRALIVLVSWKLRRSAAPQHVNVVYEVRRARNTLGFNVLRGTYHSRQGFGGQIFGLTYTHVPAGALTFSMVNSSDDLIERYAGYRVGYSLGVPRFRFSINYSSFRSQWKTNTLEADRQSLQTPGLYRLRDTLSGVVTISSPLSRNALLGVSAQVDFTELQMQSPTVGFQKSNALRGSVRSNYSERTDRHSLEWRWSYAAAAGTGAIDSDFIFARHEGKMDFLYSRQSHSVQVNFQAGRISGNAPMHERFSIGNATTLRGWNKYEIAPLGGDRMVYGSAGYRYKAITGFYDAGSVWDARQSRLIRQSVGLRLGKSRCRNVLILPHPECFSVTVGFPINGGNARPSFILGMGF